MFVGWGTTEYHLHTQDFSQECVRSVTVQRIDNCGGIAENVDRQNCFLMRVDWTRCMLRCMLMWWALVSLILLDS